MDDSPRPRLFCNTVGNKVSSQEYDGLEENENIESMIDFDTMLQDPCETPVPLTLDFLKGITNDFSEDKVLGRGGFGVVYKGVLRNGNAIAVKRLKVLETNINDEEYQKELINLFWLENKNVVQFKGFCAHSSEVLWAESLSQGRGQPILVEIRERLLCFEYLSNKSLRDHISDASCGLEWPVRHDIMKGICSGLYYLHTERGIAHMDLKPENILLDDNMVPKISDFGTSRLFGENQSRVITENSVGSRGYMAPEYLNRGMISKKADIFSLGVIILELITGSKFDYPERKELFRQFTEDVVRRWKNRLPDAKFSRQLRKCVSIALKCVDANRDIRPTTGDIIKKLDEAQDSSSAWSWVQKSRKIAFRVGSTSSAPPPPLQGGFDPLDPDADQPARALTPDQVTRFNKTLKQREKKHKQPAALSREFSSLPSAWLDRESGAKCYMVAARAMSICWGDVPSYWRWIPRADSRFQECIELLAVCWLDMAGNIASAMLSKDTRYAAYLVFKMAPVYYGLDSPLQEASITIGEVTTALPVRLQGYADYEENDNKKGTEGEVVPRLPRERPDGWMELEIGDWYNSGGDDGVVCARVKETREGGNWKKGLIVQGLEIRPKQE